MQFPSISQLIPILQTAIGPVILISGVGLILLTMTNRLGQTVNRIRNLNDNLVKANVSRRTKVISQIQILIRRARLIRLAILLAATSALVVDEDQLSSLPTPERRFRGVLRFSGRH